ncbi:MAG: 3-phosphoshikimate 1-carboxyvinyltransferase [Candidatus Omnitrophica bacterium]|nr:3-phosphoshikimate 1-carboxyvinyltransferase [Candidatus Omnitrophota bacterium]
MSYLIKPCRKIQGILNLPGDKSISHRAIILSSIAKGKTKIKNFSFSDDCKATLRAFKSLGVKIKTEGKNNICVYGVGIQGLKKPKHIINLGESGTSVRILAGLLSAQNFSSKLDGELSLRRRPMLRVIRPLRLMGANIKAQAKGRDEYPPIAISPSKLKPLDWKMTVASAQVKSAILLAGLYAKGKTKIYEPIKSRDHTEGMLRYFGADIKIKGRNIYIKPSKLISPKKIYIPADISSAAFFIALACLLKNSCIRIKNLGLNPSRAGTIDILKKMGANIKIIYKRKRYSEPIADVVVKSSQLKSVKVTKDKIPILIDELPILMVAASLVKGKSVFEGVEELRVKETDRISSMVWNLSNMGVNIEAKVKEKKEVIIINGCSNLRGAELKSFGDHRTAMSMIIAALCADSPSRIDDVKCIGKSFPNFLMILKKALC